MLTGKQKNLLLFIHDRLQKEGIPPSFDEMRDAVGLKSKSGIHSLINGLEERGFIRRLHGKARALEVLRLPEDSPATATPRRSSIAPPAPFPAMGAMAQANIMLPLYGRIAAGTPIEAIADTSSFIEVPAGIFRGAKGVVSPDDHYALQVAGDSMINAGIMDGDHVIIRRCGTADNGSIVVALLKEENEATLKKLERRDGKIALIPANPNYETKIYDPAQIEVQGKLISLLRKY